MLFTIRSHDTLPQIIVSATETILWVDVEECNLLLHPAKLLPSLRRGYKPNLVATQPIIKLITSAVADLYNAAACDKFFLQLCFVTFIHPFGDKRRRHYVAGRGHTKCSVAWRMELPNILAYNVNKNPTRCNSMQIFIYCKATLQ